MSDQLTIDELRAYQAGLLSGSERHRVEQLLLENPFYADALEGLEALQQSGKSLTKQTAELRQALQERVHESATERRLMPLWMTSAAASIILVLSVAIYMIYFMKPTFQPVSSSKPMVFEVELTPAKPVAKASAQADSVITTQTVQARQQPPVSSIARSDQRSTKTATAKSTVAVTSKPLATKGEVVSKTESLATSYPAKLPQTAVVAQATPTSGADYSVASKKATADSVHHQLSRTLPAMAPSGNQAGSQARVAQATYSHPPVAGQSTIRMVSGVIIDDQKQPLPGVSVLVNGTKRGVITDAKGAFTLDSLRQNAQLTAAYIGYQQKMFLASDLPKGPIQLEADTQSLSEVVVTGYGVKKKTSAKPASVADSQSTGTAPALPISFDEFVSKNKNLSGTESSKIHGQVVVRFKIQKDGLVGRVQIKKSLGQVADDEALRLIRAYPHWPKGWQEANVAF